MNPLFGEPIPGAQRFTSEGVEIFMDGAWHRVESAAPPRPAESMTYEAAVEAARRVRDIPAAAQAIMDRWLDGADRTVENLVLAGYDRPDHKEADAYLGLASVGIQRPRESAATLGLPWTCP